MKTPNHNHNPYLVRRVRIKKGFVEIMATKSPSAGPNAINAYPIPADTVIPTTISQLFNTLPLFYTQITSYLLHFHIL